MAKKRVTHIGSHISLSIYNKHYENKSEDLEFDVHSIMEEMDKSFDLANPNKCNKQLQSNNSDCLNVPDGPNKTQILHATSNENSDAEKKAGLKFKKFSTSRKYPLMEKSQKILKQLKHNRSIPKPRAHLASTFELLNEDIKVKSSNSLQNKKGQFKHKKIRKKVTKKKLQKVTSIGQSSQKDTTVYDNKSKNLVIQNAEQSSPKTSKAYLNIGNINDKFNSNNLDHNINNISLQKSTEDKNSINDTTDSEYEKFIKNSKINLKEVPKNKTLKKKKTMSNKMSKHLRKSISIENFPEECNSNFQDSSDDSCQDICTNVTEVKSNDDKSETVASQNFEHEDNSKIKHKTMAKKKKIMPSRMSKRLRKSISIENIPEECNSNFQDSSDDSYQDICTNVTEVKSNDDKSETVSSQNFEHEDNSKIKHKIMAKKKKIMPSRMSKRLRKSISIENIPEDCNSNFQVSTDNSCEDIFANINEATLSVSNNYKYQTATSRTCEHEYINSRIKLKPNSTYELIIQENECYNNHLAEREIITESSKTEILDKNTSDLRNTSDSNMTSNFKNDEAYVENSVLKVNTLDLKDEISRKASDKCHHEAINTECELSSDSLNSSIGKNSLLSSNSQKLNKTFSEDVSVIDLCNSDTEDVNTESIHNFIPSTEKHRDLKVDGFQRFTPIEVDSDIEIIDIKPISNCNQVLNCKKFSSSNLETSKNNNEYNEEKFCSQDENYIEHSLISAVSSVKKVAEMVNKSFAWDGIIKDTSLPVIANFDVKKEKDIKKLRKKVYENNSPVYMTNICKEFAVHESSTKTNEHLENSLISANNSINQCQSKKLYETERTEINVKCQARTFVNNTIKNEVQDKEDINVDFISVKGESAVDTPERKIERCSDLNSKNCSSYSRKISADVNAQNNFLTKINPQTLYKIDSSSSSIIEGTLPSGYSHRTEVNTLLADYNKQFEIYQNIIVTEENLKISLNFIEQQERKKLLSIRARLQELQKTDPSLYEKVHSTSIIGSNSQRSTNSNNFENSSENSVQEIRFQGNQEVNIENLQSQISSNTTLVSIKAERNIDTSKLEPFSASTIASSIKCKSEPQENIQTLRLFGKKCVVCEKEAVAACQNCVKVFFCSNECGMLFWSNGHEDVCGK